MLKAFASSSGLYFGIKSTDMEQLIKADDAFHMELFEFWMLHEHPPKHPSIPKKG